MIKILPDGQKTIFANYKLAEILGLNTAVILGRIIWSLESRTEKDREKFFVDGRWWMYESIPGFAKYSTIGRHAIIRSLQQLRDLGLIESRQLAQKEGRNENFYSVDSVKILKLMDEGGLVAKPDEGGLVAKPDEGGLVAKPDEGQLQNRTKVSCKTGRRLVAKPDDLSMSLSKSLSRSRSKSPARAEISPPPKIPKAKILKHTAEDLDIAKLWLDYAKREMSWTKPPSTWTHESFAEELYKIRTTTNLNYDGLRAVLEFIENDPFWVKNALSPGSLLKKSRNDIRKIDNILGQMKPKSLRQEEKMKSWGNNSDTLSPFIF